MNNNDDDNTIMVTVTMFAIVIIGLSVSHLPI